MDNIFILNPTASSFDIKDAIDERLTKAKAITQSLLTYNTDEAELLHSCLHNIIWAVDDYLSEIKFLQDCLMNNF